MEKIVEFDEVKAKYLLDNYHDYEFAKGDYISYPDSYLYDKNKIISKSNLEKLITGLSYTEIIYKMMRWLHILIKPHLEILDYTIGGEELIHKATTGNYSFSCACFAVTFNDIMLALGVKSKAVWCMSSNFYDDECHVINHVYNPDIEKWMIVDVAFGCCIKNMNDEFIDIIQLRDAIRVQEGFQLYKSKNYVYSEEDLKRYMNYMLKNTFMFITPKRSGMFHIKSEKSKFYVAVPSNYNDLPYENNYIKTSNAAVLF